jgi:hypothetical protein
VNVAVVDVGEVRVLVFENEVAVLVARDDLDGIGRVVRIARVDLMRVLDGLVDVPMGVMR